MGVLTGWHMMRWTLPPFYELAGGGGKVYFISLMSMNLLWGLREQPVVRLRGYTLSGLKFLHVANRSISLFKRPV